MIAHTVTPETQRIKKLHLGAGSQQRRKKIIWQFPRAERIHQHAHLHAALHRGDQRGQKLPPRAAIGVDVGFQADGDARRADGFEHGGKNFPAIAEPLQDRCWRRRHVAP